MNRTIQCLFLSSLASAAFAGSFTVCSTGFASATTSGCGAAINSPGANTLTADGNWYQSSNSSGTFLGQAFVTINNSYPIQNAGPWLANNAATINGVGSGSSWITPSASQGQTFANGNFYYSSHFTAAATPGSNASINGYWLADDYGGAVYLNGTAVSQSAMPVFGGLGGPMVPFSISNGSGVGQAQFVGGQNTLTFQVVNDSTNRGQFINGSTPTGLRVQIGSSFDGLNGSSDSVPEPSTLILIGCGLAGLGYLRRRQA